MAQTQASVASRALMTGSLAWGSPPVKSEMGGNGGGRGGFWEMCRGRCWDNQITDLVPEEDERGLERGGDMARVCGEMGTLCLLPLFHTSPPQNTLLLRSHPRRTHPRAHHGLVCISQSYNMWFILYTVQSKGKTLFGALYLFF